MTKFQYLVSTATIAVGSFVASAAYADCAADLATLRTDMNMTASVSGTASGDVAAAKDQAAAAGQGKTFTQEGGGASGGSAMGSTAKPDATGAVSGIAPTAALGKVAQGETGATTTVPGSGGAAATASGAKADNMASTTPGGDAQMAMQNMTAAQTALDQGNEAACAAAVQQARQAMGN